MPESGRSPCRRCPSGSSRRRMPSSPPGPSRPPRRCRRTWPRVGRCARIRAGRGVRNPPLDEQAAAVAPSARTTTARSTRTGTTASHTTSSPAVETLRDSASACRHVRGTRGEARRRSASWRVHGGVRGRPRLRREPRRDRPSPRAPARGRGAPRPLRSRSCRAASSAAMARAAVSSASLAPSPRCTSGQRRQRLRSIAFAPGERPSAAGASRSAPSRSPVLGASTTPGDALATPASQSRVLFRGAERLDRLAAAPSRAPASTLYDRACARAARRAAPTGVVEPQCARRRPARRRAEAALGLRVGARPRCTRLADAHALQARVAQISCGLEALAAGVGAGASTRAVIARGAARGPRVPRATSRPPPDRPRPIRPCEPREQALRPTSAWPISASCVTARAVATNRAAPPPGLRGSASSGSADLDDRRADRRACRWPPRPRPLPRTTRRFRAGARGGYGHARGLASVGVRAAPLECLGLICREGRPMSCALGAEGDRLLARACAPPRDRRLRAPARPPVRAQDCGALGREATVEVLGAG